MFHFPSLYEVLVPHDIKSKCGHAIDPSIPHSCYIGLVILRTEHPLSPLVREVKVSPSESSVLVHVLVRVLIVKGKESSIKYTKLLTVNNFIFLASENVPKPYLL